MALKETRYFKRYLKVADVVLKFKNKYSRAQMIDYSLDGLALVSENILSIEKGDVIELSSKDPEIMTFGEVVWSIIETPYLRFGVKNIGRLKGLSKDFRLSDTLIGLQRSQKTGILIYESGNIVKKIYLRNGDMIFSASNQNKDRLGDILLGNGTITSDQYDHSVSELKRTGQRQGAILVRLGYLDPQGLITAVKNQVEEIIRSLFLLEEGRFSFEEMPLPIDEVITLKLSAANLIYYGTKGIKNSERITGELSSLERIPCFSSDPLDLFQDIKLDHAGRKVVSYIDGKTSIKNIMSLSELDGFELLKTIYALLNVRLIEIQDTYGASDDMSIAVVEKLIGKEEERAEEIDLEVKAAIEDIHRRYEDLGYYGILGISRNSSLTEVKTAYYKAAKKFHPDIHYYVSEGSLKDKLSDIFSFVYEAYKTLSDPQKRKDYDKLATIKPPKSATPQDKARAAFEEGKNQFRKNNFPEAELLFGQAAYYDSSISEYQYHYSLVLVKLNKLKAAEKAVERALGLEPTNTTYISELGFIYLGLGFPLRAKGLFEKALKMDPGHAKALEGMKKIPARD